MMRSLTRTLFRMTPLLLVGLLSACAGFGQQPAPLTQDLALPAMEPQLVERATYTVARGELVDKVEFDGEVALSVQEDLFFSTPGRVRTVYVENGDMVQEGDLIAELDTRDLNFELQQAQYEHARAQQRLAEGQAAVDFARQDAELDLEIAKLRLEAYQKRDDPDPEELAIRERQVEQAELVVSQPERRVGATYDLSRLETDVALAELRLEQVAAKLEDAQIVSPFDGEVQLYPELEAGGGVPAYEAVARLVDPGSYEIVASLVRDDMEYLFEGMPVTARLNGAYGDAELAGVIATLPQPFGSGLGTSTVIELDDPEAVAQLRAGATVELAAELNRQEAALWLPPEAVRGFGDNRFVLVEETGGNLREVAVVVGVSNSEQVEILDGAFEGMTVVGQ